MLQIRNIHIQVPVAQKRCLTILETLKIKNSTNSNDEEESEMGIPILTMSHRHGSVLA